MTDHTRHLLMNAYRAAEWLLSCEATTDRLLAERAAEGALTDAAATETAACADLGTLLREAGVPCGGKRLLRGTAGLLDVWRTAFDGGGAQWREEPIDLLPPGWGVQEQHNTRTAVLS